MNGIDVSNNQGTIRWDEVKAYGISFAYLKTSEGRTYKDAFYAANRAACKKRNIPSGGYHFLRPKYGPAEVQAKHFFSLCKPVPGDLIPCVDVEVTDGKGREDMGRFVKDFAVEFKRLSGLYPVVYCAPGWWDGAVGGEGAAWTAAHCPLWVANWGVSKPQLPKGWKSFVCWQYSSTGRVPGVAGSCDMNRSATLGPLTISKSPAPPEVRYDVYAGGKKKFANVRTGSVAKRVIGQLKKFQQVRVKTTEKK